MRIEKIFDFFFLTVVVWKLLIISTKMIGDHHHHHHHYWHIIDPNHNHRLFESIKKWMNYNCFNNNSEIGSNKAHFHSRYNLIVVCRINVIKPGGWRWQRKKKLSFFFVANETHAIVARNRNCLKLYEMEKKFIFIFTMIQK